MDDLYIQTPLLKSEPLSKEVGVPIYLKMEALQPSGSYKDRGLILLLSDYVAKGLDSFITASCGNSGISLAQFCQVYKSRLKVVVPVNTSKLMKDKMEQLGAEVIVHGDNYENAAQKAKAIAEKEKITYVNSQNDPLIFEGISTIIYEIFGAGLKPGAIVLSAGCGDLLAGVLQGLHSCQWDDIPIITAEREDACDFATARFAEQSHANNIIPEVFTMIKNHPLYSEIVTNKAAYEASKRFANDHRVLVEPALASSLAVVYGNLPLLKTFSSVLCIVSGGSNVDLSIFKP